MDHSKPLGRHKAAELRDDTEGLEAIADLTGLAVAEVAERLHGTHGKTRVSNALRAVWPWTAGSLGTRNVAHARRYGLNREIEHVTRASRVLVSRRLNAAHGRQLLKNLFWDWWPDEEPAPPESEVESADEEAQDAPDAVDAADGTDDEPGEIGPGKLLSGRYEILSYLGKGGFGTTWIAHDRLSDLDIVAKIPHTDDGGAIRNELRWAFRLVHPNVCQAFPERDDDTGQPFLVMQHGGADLAQRLQTGEPFPLALAVHVLVSVADALDYLHEQFVLHLDVSPGNILIDEDDVVRLTDFGASSRARAEQGAAGVTEVATTLHSIHHGYAAPEVYSGKARSRSDQYSLFRVFCSLLEGRVHTSPHYEFRPFDGLSSAQNDIIARALAHDPERRFDSCAEPARALADDMAAVPETVLTHDLARLMDHLVHRMAAQHQRMKSGTVRLGGAVKIGRGLERILQATLIWMGAIDGFDPLTMIRGRDANASTIDRATAGTIARTIMKQAEEPAAQAHDRPEIALLVSDLRSGKRSKIWGLVNARNDVLHGRRPADAILPAALEVADLLRAQLRDLQAQPS